uniref:Ankyrin repeat protein n=1 Tax=Marseillevirus LCMAC101 TaxID=2506602 RepID=A0A481YRV2_9VIRU|nr:MAG: ankyrin repeat protein [Marseillevirus LCMAC101]
MEYHEDPFIGALSNACRKRDIEVVRELIDKGVDVITVNSALFGSIMNGYFDVFRILIEEGKADINGNRKDIPLIDAVDANRYVMVGYLLNHGADINAQEEDTGNTALHQAAAVVGRMSHVYKLLDEGADYEIEDNKGKKPLNLLNQTEQLNVDDYIKYVLPHGKNIKRAKN